VSADRPSAPSIYASAVPTFLVCQLAGCDLPLTSNQRGQKYCSVNHRVLDYKRRNPTPRPPRVAVCALHGCEIEFIAARSTRLYCSDQHRWAAKDDRRRNLAQP
jgi:hypothetical protein